MKVRHSILAVLALLFSATMFTACGSDDDDKAPAKDTTPYAIGMYHSFILSGDFLDYFNVDIIIDNARDASGNFSTAQVTKRVEKKDLNNGDFEIAQLAKLPATLTVSRKVTLKDDVDYSAISSMQFVVGHYYKYGIYNVKGELLNSELENGILDRKTVNASSQQAVQDVVKRVSEGKFDMRTRTYPFDKNGEWVSTDTEEETNEDEAE